MSNNSTTAAILLALCISLVACADPKAANQSNFATAINNYLAQGAKDKLCLTTVGFPHSSLGSAEVDGPDRTAQLNELIDAGLVHKTHKVKYITGGYTAPYREDSDYYELTPTGVSLVSDNDHFTSRICFAKLVVGKIENFTEPGSSSGVTVSNVSWFPALADIDQNMQRLLDAKKLRSVQRLIDQTTTTQQAVTVQLTNNGWEVAQ
jgi:hypothetical protein